MQQHGDARAKIPDCLDLAIACLSTPILRQLAQSGNAIPRRPRIPATPASMGVYGTLLSTQKCQSGCCMLTSTQAGGSMPA